MLGQDRKANQELYIWHKREPITTISRFYFRETMTYRLFAQKIRPMLVDTPNMGNVISVRGYPNYIAVEWLNDLDADEISHTMCEKDVERHVDLVLSLAFGWNSSMLRTLKNYQEVREKVGNSGLNWDKGQLDM